MDNSCFTIHKLFNNPQKYAFPFEETAIPLNGIYIIFEKSEKSHGTNRIVRVGTHTGNNQLRSRLRQHFIVENKDRSIFRKNIGRCILNKNHNPHISKWELDLTSENARNRYSKDIDFNKQRIIEKEVSKYIRDNFTFVVFEVQDKTERLMLESRIISTLSLCKECKPSKNWLGNYSTKEKIKTNGLWLVNELNKQPLSFEDIKSISSYITTN